MKLFPDAAVSYADLSGACNTGPSRRTTLGVLGLLQSKNPGLDLTQFRTEHLTRFCLAPGIAPGTTRSRKSKLVSFFDWTTYRGMTKKNPATDLKFTVRVRPQGVKHHHWLTEPEVVDLIRSCDTDLLGRRNRLVLMIGTFLGLRREEISLVRWGQFSTDLSSISIIGKGRKLAQLGVPSQLRDELATWRADGPPCSEVVLPWFTTDRIPLWHKPISEANVYRVVRQAGARINYPDLAPHDLRRSYAGILEAKGVPLQDISKLLRHSNVGITSTYLESNPHKVKALGAAFELGAL